MELKKLVALQRLGFEGQDAFLCLNNNIINKIETSTLDESDALYISNNNLKLHDIISSSYPLFLRLIDSPPLVLTIKGNSDVLNTKCVSIVGARKATQKGREIAFELARDLAKEGFTIVSGLAYGIDTSAHYGALSVNGKTIAVIGCGIDVDYPARNHQLKEKIVLDGAIVSEFPLSTRAYPANFPRRNRIISGLSMATIIIEASLNSGSLITANYALDQGREVFVAQDSDFVYMAGNRKLIQEGAIKIDNAKDVISCIYSNNYNNSGHKAIYDKKAQNIISLSDVASLAGSDILTLARFYKNMVQQD